MQADAHHPRSSAGSSGCPDGVQVSRLCETRAGYRRDLRAGEPVKRPSTLWFTRKKLVGVVGCLDRREAL